MIAGEADLCAGQEEDLVCAALRPAAISGAFADRVGGAQEGVALVGREGIQEAGDRVVGVYVGVPYLARGRGSIGRVLRGVPCAGGCGAVEPLPDIGIDIAVVAVVSTVTVAVCCLHRVEAQHFDDLRRHEGDAVARIAGVVFVAHCPDDRLAVKASELDFRLCGEVSQFLSHLLYLLSVLVLTPGNTRKSRSPCFAAGGRCCRGICGRTSSHRTGGRSRGSSCHRPRSCGICGSCASCCRCSWL